MSPTLRSEPPDDHHKVIVGGLIGLVVILSVAIAVLAVELHHAGAMAMAQPCVSSPGLSPDAPVGAGEAHLPSAESLSPTIHPAPAPAPAPVPVPVTTSEIPPPEVVSYLKFMQGMDEKRVQLQAAAKMSTPAGQTAEASIPASTGDAPPSSPAPTGGVTTPTPPATQANEVTAQWQSLITEFRSQSPPTECSLLAAGYLTFLIDSEASQQTPSSSSNPASDAVKVESELSKVCSTTHAVKTFIISYPGTPAAPVQQ